MIRISVFGLVCLALVASSHTEAEEPKAMKPTEVIKRLDNAIKYEVEAKNLPSFSIALVDGDRTVWSRDGSGRFSGLRKRMVAF